MRSLACFILCSLFLGWNFSRTGAQVLLTPTSKAFGQVVRCGLRNELPILSVLTSAISRDKQYITPFARNVLAMANDVSWELIVASADHHLLNRFERLCKKISLVRVYLEYDPGLYETWDLMIGHVARGHLITNWNLDDMKLPNCFSVKTKYLFEHPTVDLLTSAVIPVHSNRSRVGKDIWWNYTFSRNLQVNDLIACTSEGKFTPHNMPHNSPIWRRRMIDKYGNFSSCPWVVKSTQSNRALGCSDWGYWMYALHNGLRAAHIGIALDVYMIRPDSRGHEEDDYCSPVLLKKVEELGYSSGTYCRSCSKRVLVVHELAPSAFRGGDVRLRQALHWLRLNNHDVTLVVRQGENLRWVDKPDMYEAETLSWLKQHDIPMLRDPHFEAVNSMNGFDVVILTLWFWRGYRSNVSSIPSLVLPRLSTWEKKPRVVLLSDDLHWKRCEQVSIGKEDERCLRKDEIELEESTLYSDSRVDLLVALTTHDQFLFQQIAPNQNVAVLPMVIDELMELRPSRRFKFRIIFVGSKHPANIKAVSFLLFEMLPHFALTNFARKSTIMLVGDGWEKFLLERGMQLSQRCTKLSFVKVCAPGTVSDDSSLFDERTLLVAPTLTKGTGISTKVYLGLTHQVPVVTTPAGVYGIPCDNNQDSTLCRLLYISEPTGSDFASALSVAMLHMGVMKRDGLTIPNGISYSAWRTSNEWMSLWTCQYPQ